ncbi:uncharacterized protein LOC143277007 isoform X5 [Babylonia areolata]|uniref:uncharacterized protein LOC143277007 isoform X3 n=1 Tax=Babylonia areolata TaxID=304850 RepID=UPI003FD165F6
MSSVYKTEIVHCTLLLSYFSLIFATQAGERNSESVEVTFYQLSDSEWNSSQSSFKTLVATEASSYCASYSDCGLSSGFIFTAHEVGVSSGPTADSKSLKISFYIDFPVVHTVSGSSSTTYVVSSAVTAKILANVRTAAESVVGHDITYIGTEFYSIDPDAFLNKIIIPVACVVLLLVVVLAVGLHLWSKSKAKEAVKRQRSVEKERRKKSSRVTPTHSVAREGKEYNPFWPGRHRRERSVEKEAVVKLKTDAGTTHVNNGSGFQGHSGKQGHIDDQRKRPTLSLKTSTITYQ